MLRCGADPNITDTHGFISLIIMVWGGFRKAEIIESSKEVVLKLLKHGADPNLVSRTTNTTPLSYLSYLCAGGDNHGDEIVDIAKILVDYGTNVHILNEKGKTAKQIAAYKNKTEIVKYLQEIENKNIKVYPLTSICAALIYKNYPIFKTKLINYPPLLLMPTNLLEWFRREEELRDSMALVRYNQ